VNPDAPSEEPFVPRRLLPNIELPKLKWPNCEPENREAPNAEPALRAAKFDSARVDEIAEFIPLAEVVPKERVPEERPLEAVAPLCAVDAPANE
jgi:hypothetical protein